MKTRKRFFLAVLAVLLVALIFPISVSAAPIEQGRTIFGETYTLESGRVLNGDLNVIGGVVNIEDGAFVSGNVFVLGGLVTVDGTVEGNLIAIGGTVNIGESALVEGDLVSPASFINRDEGAVIQGQQYEGWNIPWTDFDLPLIYHPRIVRTPGMRIIPIVTQIGRGAASTFVLVGLAALMLLVMPKASEVMTDALIAEPWHILGYGALTALVMLIGGIILTITICLIPVVIIVGLAFALAILAGWLALGYELGKRIATSIFKANWHPVISAAVGNLILFLVAKSLDLIPCLGWFLVFVAMLFSLGMAVVTLFGTKPYPRKDDRDDGEQVVLFEEKETKAVASTEDDEDMGMAKVPVEEKAQSALPIETLGLDTRINNVLKEAGLVTVAGVLERLERGDRAMLEIEGFGPKSLTDLKAALEKRDYEFPGQ